MGTFGERLRREREMRGIGLEEIAAATKISTRNLKALEDEKFNQLPGGIFNKGFVRAYAKFLGIDAEQVVAEYEATAEQTENAREQKFRQELSKDIRSNDEREINLEPKSQWGTIAVIVLVAVLGFTGYSFYQKKKTERAREAQQAAAAAQLQQAKQQAPPVQPPTTNPVTPPVDATGQTTTGTPANTTATATPPTGVTTAPTGTNPVTAPTVPAAQKNTTQTPAVSTEKPADAGPSPINLVVKVNQETWMSVKADGKTLINGTITQGTERSFKAKDKIEVVLGRAKGVEISYNGKSVDDLKTGQDVRKFTFTPSGYE